MSASVFDKLSKEARQGTSINFSGKIELPFPHIKLWWKNGGMEVPQENSVRHYGGWALSFEEYPSVQETNPNGLPSYFSEPMAFVNRAGEQYEIFTSRYIAMSLIDIRSAWFTRDDGGNYSRTQALVYLGDLVVEGEQKVLRPWGPAVLSTSGYSGKYLKEALQAWKRQVAPALNKHSIDVSPWLFYGFIGTLGKERYIEQVGSHKTSPITPAQCRNVGDITKEDLEKWFVGLAHAEKFVTMREEAQEWLHAWDDIEDEEDDSNDYSSSSSEDNGQDDSDYNDFQDVDF